MHDKGSTNICVQVISCPGNFALRQSPLAVLLVVKASGADIYFHFTCFPSIFRKCLKYDFVQNHDVLQFIRNEPRIYFSFRKKREANLSSSVYMALCFQVLPMRIYIIYAMSIYGLVSSPCGFSVFGENFLG